jgi:hypothetical protein
MPLERIFKYKNTQIFAILIILKFASVEKRGAQSNNTLSG